jgi:hypothetical protein
MSIFSIGKEEQSIPEEPRDLETILARISASASGRDEHPSFPEDPFARLAPTGVLAIPVPDPIGRQGRRASFAHLERVLRQHDVPIHRLLSVRVTTSPRLEGRATRGLSYDLARIAHSLHEKRADG